MERVKYVFISAYIFSIKNILVMQEIFNGASVIWLDM